MTEDETGGAFRDEEGDENKRNLGGKKYIKKGKLLKSEDGEHENRKKIRMKKYENRGNLFLRTKREKRKTE